MHNKLHEREVKKTKKMKKYYQLALALVCMVSVVTLLFYRHEYYRLRYVLEVLNFFGKPGYSNVDPDCLSSNFSLVDKNRPSITEPLPSWQRLSDSHYVYSAFWENADGNYRASAISVGTEEINLKFGCHLWYDLLDEPVAGEFSYKTAKNKKHPVPSAFMTLVAYDLYCTLALREITGTPYGVSFYKTEDANHSVAYIPVHFSAPSTPNVTTVCIAPTAKHSIPKSSIVEFLSYHQLIGVTEFIIYNSGSVSRVASVLSHSSILERLGLDISYMPWNFPYPGSYDISRSIIESDCILRTKGNVRSVAVLDWNEYIVPKYHNSLSAMLDDLGKTSSLFKLSKLTFCTQFADHRRSTKTDPIFLRKTHYVVTPDLPAVIYQPEQAGATTQKILPGIAVVHRYSHCTTQQSSSQENADSTMLRFAGDLGRSHLLKSWHSGKLFD